MDYVSNRVGNCTICGEPVTKGSGAIVSTKRGKICAHTECYENEQRELKAEKEAEAWK